MAKDKKKKSPLKKFLIALGSILGAVVLVLVGARAYFRLSVLNYYQISEKGFIIPECNDNFIAQGLDYDETTDNFFMTGYMNDKSASPVYIMKKGEQHEYKKVLLANEDGTAFKGHAGGISVTNDYVYIAGGSSASLHVYSKAAIMSAENGASVNSIGEFKTHNGDDSVNISFTTVYEGRIYVGEFYRAGNYETKESHHTSVANDKVNKAIMTSYRLSDDETLGINPEPLEFFSLPNLVQGCAFDNNGYLHLSTSYGAVFSNIYTYDLTKATSKTMNLLGSDRNVKLLDDTSLINSYKIAPMSEEIEIVDGKMYTMCESASNKYIFGKLTSAYWCYVTDVTKMLAK